MREFIIRFDWPESVPVICSEDDTFGVIGEILSRVSQLDEDESLVITCVGNQVPEHPDM